MLLVQAGTGYSCPFPAPGLLSPSPTLRLPWEGTLHPSHIPPPKAMDPIEVPEGQASAPSLFLAGVSPSGWGSGKNKSNIGLGWGAQALLLASRDLSLLSTTHSE